MPDQPSKIVQFLVLERKKQLALSRQAIARSRRLIAGSKEIVQRSKEAHERCRAIRKTIGERKAA